jgi:hypothetical protein
MSGNNYTLLFHYNKVFIDNMFNDKKTLFNQL